jgi:TusA-related sulfurtransferase
MDIQPADSFSTKLEVCYEVKLYLTSLMAQLAEGEVLEFISSDPHAMEELEPWSELRGYEILDIQPLDDNRIRFLIRR